MVCYPSSLARTLSVIMAASHEPFVAAAEFAFEASTITCHQLGIYIRTDTRSHQIIIPITSLV